MDNPATWLEVFRVWATENAAILTFLSAIAAIASAIAVGVYTVLTYSVLGATREQAKASTTQATASMAQLEELRTQTALAYIPKVLFKRSKSKETYPPTITLYNFNRYPILVDFIRFHFRGKVNHDRSQLWGLTHLGPMRERTIAPFDSIGVPLPSSIDGEEPTLLLSLYYGGTGSQRYEYKAKVSLIDGRVNSETLKPVEGDNRFGFV